MFLFFFQSICKSELLLNHTHFYLLAATLLFFSFSFDLKIYDKLHYSFCKVIVFVAFVESFVCFAQYFNFIPSLSKYFAVTGTWENPNVTGMFLAMASTACFIILRDKKTLYKYVAVIILIAILLAIIILKTRSAILGGIIICSPYFLHKLRFLSTSKQKWVK